MQLAHVRESLRQSGDPVLSGLQAAGAHPLVFDFKPERGLDSLPRLFSFRSMAVETLGGMAARVEAHRAVRLRQTGRDEIDPHLHLPGAAGHADAGLDARPNFPLSRLESRLMCPECGSRRVSLLFDVPKLPVAASAKRVTER